MCSAMVISTLLLLGLLPFSFADPVRIPKIDWVNCKHHVPTSLQINQEGLKTLPSSLHCGRLTVPMNYDKPISPENNITLGLAMHRPRQAKGAIFFNPGGSDEATVYAWQSVSSRTEVFAGLMDFDLMMMDVRGTYSSNPLNVSLRVFDDLLGAYPSNQSQFEDFRAASARSLISWADMSSPPGILQHLGTKEIVQDFEQVRRALGYEKINLLGDSYGSFRFVQYAATFPHRVDRIVLDAVVPHGRAIFQQAQDQMASANRGVLRADAYCQDHEDCPLKKDGKGSVVRALNSALKGDATILATMAGDPIPNLESVWAVPLICNDYDLGNNTFEAFNGSFEAASTKDAVGIRRTQAWQIQLWCSAWPFRTPRVQPISLPDIPMLLVTADFDVAAPTEWAREAWFSFPKSTLMIRHGDDHVSFTLPDQPSTHYTKEYLRTGRLPAPRDEELVSIYSPGMALKPIKDPYEVPTGSIAGDVDSES